MSKKSITDEINEQKTRGVLLILTGPTGAGKDTLFAALKEKNPTIQRKYLFQRLLGRLE